MERFPCVAVSAQDALSHKSVAMRGRAHYAEVDPHKAADESVLLHALSFLSTLRLSQGSDSVWPRAHALSRLICLGRRGTLREPCCNHSRYAAS